MCKKLLPSLLLLGFLILVPLKAHAAFNCDGATLAGSFAGTLAGTVGSLPTSGFAFLTLASNGTLTYLEIFSEPGVPWQQDQGAGTWTPFFTTQGFCIIMLTIPGGTSFIANIADDANSIQLSTPNDPNVQAAGSFRRSGT